MSTSKAPPKTEDVQQNSVVVDSADNKFTSLDLRRSSSASSSTSTSASTSTVAPPPLTTPQLTNCIPHSHDTPLALYTSHISIDDRIYDRIPLQKKHIIVALISYCSFLAPISSTTVLSAVPEVAAEFGTTGSV